jgi:hypothetical protein
MSELPVQRITSDTTPSLAQSQMPTLLEWRNRGPVASWHWGWASYRMLRERGMQAGGPRCRSMAPSRNFSSAATLTLGG